MVSTEKLLAKTEQVCEQKKQSYEEMTKLRNQESVALARAVAIIKGTVVANSASLNSKVGKTLLQIRSSSQQSFYQMQELVSVFRLFKSYSINRDTFRG